LKSKGLLDLKAAVTQNHQKMRLYLIGTPVQESRETMEGKIDMVVDEKAQGVQVPEMGVRREVDPQDSRVDRREVDLQEVEVQEASLVRQEAGLDRQEVNLDLQEVSLDRQEVGLRAGDRGKQK